VGIHRAAAAPGAIEEGQVSEAVELPQSDDCLVKPLTGRAICPMWLRFRSRVASSEASRYSRTSTMSFGSDPDCRPHADLVARSSPIISLHGLCVQDIAAPRGHLPQPRQRRADPAQVFAKGSSAPLLFRRDTDPVCQKADCTGRVGEPDAGAVEALADRRLVELQAASSMSSRPMSNSR
jgi:hypothetical protein